MGEILAVVMNLSVLVFVITSMLAMGLSLTAWQVTAVPAQRAIDKVPVWAGPS